MALLFAVISQGTFIFAAPGAVYIASRSSYFGEGIDRKANGIISLVGPLVNIAAAAIFGLALLVSTALGLGDIVIGHSFYFLQEGVQINLVLGAFNMIPFFILDGQKVFTWDRRIWAAVAIPLWRSRLRSQCSVSSELLLNLSTLVQRTGIAGRTLDKPLRFLGQD